MNLHYYNRYLKFIDSIKLKGKRSLEYIEIHHIIPKSLGGKDEKENLIELSLREHFIAHWLLYNSYLGKNMHIMFAFIKMCEQNSNFSHKKKYMKFEKFLSSRVFEKKKKEFYNSSNFGIKKGEIVCYDSQLDKKVKISKKEYYLNSERYITSTKNKVLAKDSDGNKIIIPKDVFRENNEYVGQTKGLTTVYDIHKKEYVQISIEEFQKNKDIYQGPAKGKYNVINMITGVRLQIEKQLYNPEIHLFLGNITQYFKAINKLTKKEKNISIFEWKLVFNEYDIYDQRKFNEVRERWKKYL